MNAINERSRLIRLRDFMDEPDGWGRAQGREVHARLLAHVERNPGIAVFRVSLEDVRRVDISFASETIVELARRYRGLKGFCLVDALDTDMVENWEAAAAKKGQPILVWDGERARALGVEPSSGNRDALAFAMSRSPSRAAEFAEGREDMSIANASAKFKQLWQQGFLLRREGSAGSGGTEFIYHRIG